MPFPTHLITPLLILAGLVLLPYVVGPILIRCSMRQSANPTLGSFPAGDPKLPKAVAKHFRKTLSALEPLGFEVVEGLTLPDQTPRVKALVLMLANRPARDIAVVTAIYAAEQGIQKLKTAYVEFVSRYRDGTVVQTNNTATLGAFAPRPGVITNRLPSVAEPERLYRLHHALAAQDGGESGKVLVLDEEFKGDAAAYLAWAIRNELQGQVETGYLYEDEEAAAFRPTWKGALLMTWGLLWPLKAIRTAQRDRLARQIIAELEADSRDKER
jgi:hypothetical protein